MALGVLAVDELPDDLQALLVRRAEGNPFFVEEVLRSLQETGALRRGTRRLELTRDLTQVVVPDTVQDVILTRIQRLDDAPRRLLEVASVIGRQFSRRLVDHLAESREASEHALRELKMVELIYESSVFPELTYTFKHALTQEVAYASLAASRRRELHRRTALAIEDLDRDRLAERLDVLAYHFSRAEDWTRAVEYLVKAADKAWSVFAVREALALYDEALAAVVASPGPVDLQTVMTIRQARATLAFALSDFERSRTEATELLTAARQAGDREREGAALAGMAQASLWLREFDRAVEYAHEAIAIAGPIDARLVLAEAHSAIAATRGVVGRLDEAWQEAEQAIVLSRSAGDPFREAMALGFAGLLRNWEGDFVEATALGAAALKLAEEHHLFMPSLLGFWYQGMALTGKGQYDEARRALEQELALAERAGIEIHREIALNCLGWLYAELGDLERGLALNRESAAGARKRADAETLAHAELNVADIFLVKGDLVLAQDVLDGVHRLVQAPTTSDWLKWRYSTHLFASLAELWLARGEPARAGEFADQCLDLATRTNSRKNLVKGWRLRGEIALARRDLDAAASALRQALAIAETVGNPPQLWKTHAAWGGFMRPDRSGTKLAEPTRRLAPSSTGSWPAFRTRSFGPAWRAARGFARCTSSANARKPRPASPPTTDGRAHSVAERLERALDLDVREVGGEQEHRHRRPGGVPRREPGAGGVGLAEDRQLLEEPLGASRQHGPRPGRVGREDGLDLGRVAEPRERPAVEVAHGREVEHDEPHRALAPVGAVVSHRRRDRRADAEHGSRIDSGRSIPEEPNPVPDAAAGIQEGEPSVRQLSRQPHAHGGEPGDEDGHLGHGPVAEPERARVRGDRQGDALAAKEGADLRDDATHASDGCPERDVVEALGQLGGARAEAEQEASARHTVERGCRHSDRRRRPAPHAEHARAEADLPGARRCLGQQDGAVVGPRLGQEEGVVPEAVRHLGDMEQSLTTRLERGHRHRQAAAGRAGSQANAGSVLLIQRHLRSSSRRGGIHRPGEEEARALPGRDARESETLARDSDGARMAKGGGFVTLRQPRWPPR